MSLDKIDVSDMRRVRVRTEDARAMLLLLAMPFAI